MQEFDFIKRCTESLPSQAEGLICGIGDDCAVFAGGAGRDWLLSTDGFVEGVHFRRDWMSPRGIGARCLSAAVSDIAAMGGRPRYVAIGIAIPETMNAEEAADLVNGIASAATSYQMVLIGGDTSAAPHDLGITLTVIGDVRHGAAIYRRGAKSGDVVYVTGELGGAQAGLEILRTQSPHLCKEGVWETGGIPPMPLPYKREESIVRFLHPVARVAGGQWLADTGCVTAMIDVSDGLIQDLGHVARAGGVGMVIEAAAVPRWRVTGTEVSWETACTSGEEYELAFTVDGLRDPAFQRLLPAVQGHLGHPITRIGTVVAGRKVIVKDAGGREVTPRTGGFSHQIGKGA